MANNTQIKGFRRFYRIFRWIILLALVVVIALALKRPSDIPEIPDSASVPGLAREFENKLQELQDARLRGSSGVQVELSAGEINAFVAQSMARGSAESAPPQVKPVSSQSEPAAVSSTDSKDFRLSFDGDEVLAFFVVDFHGKNLNITLSGKPVVSNGYLVFTPSGFRVGTLPIPMFLVDGAIQRRLNDPETREKLKLPDFISDLRVHNEQLVITER